MKMGQNSAAWRVGRVWLWAWNCDRQYEAFWVSSDLQRISDPRGLISIQRALCLVIP